MVLQWTQEKVGLTTSRSRMVKVKDKVSKERKKLRVRLNSTKSTQNLLVRLLSLGVRVIVSLRIINYD